MTATQACMFEPQGHDLALLVCRHTADGDTALRRAANLQDSFLPSAASIYARLADDAFERAAVCESALHFERLAGLV